MGAITSVVLPAIVALTSAGNRDALVMLAGILLLPGAAAAVGWSWGPRATVSGRRETATVVSGVALTASLAGVSTVATTLCLITIVHVHLDPAQPQLWGIQNLLGLVLVGVPTLALSSLLVTLPMAVFWRRETAERVRTGP